MPNRGAGGVSYRYGFNGKETENDVKGIGNEQDYGMRIYDPRLGRFLSVDPIARVFAMLSPYQFSNSNPVTNIDLDGAESVISITSRNTFTVSKATTADEVKKLTVTGQNARERARVDEIVEELRKKIGMKYDHNSFLFYRTSESEFEKYTRSIIEGMLIFSHSMTYISIGNSTIVTEITTADFDYSQLGEEGAQRALELRKNIVEKANNLLGLGLDFSDSKNIGLKSLNFTLSASVSGLDQATLDLIKDQVQGKIEEFLSKYLVKSMVKGAFEAVTYTLEPLDAERGSDGLGPKSILYDRIKKTASSNLLSLFLFGESKSQGFDLNPGPAKKDKAKPGSELRTGTDNTAQRKYNSSHAQ